VTPVLAVEQCLWSIELIRAERISVSDNNGSVQVSDVKGTLEVRNRFGSVTHEVFRAR